MIELKSIPENCKVDHLFLLIGTNPLPNYVAACLLSNPGAHIYLLHTDVTVDIASRLRRLLQRVESLTNTTFDLHEISSTDGSEIRHDVGKLLEQIEQAQGPNPSTGLHYTGGTAAMSVHTYSAFEYKFPQTVFSYLDARTLSMRFDGRGGQATRKVYVSEKCQVTLETLVRLHGYGGFKTEPKQQSHNLCVERIIKALLEIHSTPEGFEQWRSYGRTRYENFPDLDQYQALSPFLDAASICCGDEVGPGALAAAMGKFSQFISYSQWFNGVWIEEYVLNCVAALATLESIGSYGMGLEPIRGQRSRSSTLFEIDVAAMRGYQLFAISCMVAGLSGKESKNRYKEHLLEIYVRARQLGGDEARVALVCHFADPELLEKEIEESWFTEGRVCVFGLPHLTDLHVHLQRWFQTA